MKLSPVRPPKKEPPLLKIDVGCGKTPKDGFAGIDSIDFGQKHVLDIRKGFPFKKDSVSEVHSSHFVEHLTGDERIPFFNDLYRVMKVGTVATIITPNWSHACAYGDPTHKWPPMSPWWPLYLDKNWRTTQAPHVGFTCDFVGTVAGSWDERLNGRNPETMQSMMNEQVNAWRDLIVTLTKR